MLLSDLGQEILQVSEQSARLARAIRSEQTLFELLVEEKTGDAKNKRFQQDFKTLADVLVQEMVKHQLQTKFPGLEDQIYGEECNQFTNVLGETVEVSIKPTTQDTCKVLETVLDGNKAAAQILADIVHEEVSTTMDPSLAGCTLQIDLSEVGVWIDPIDSTAQYISGGNGEAEKTTGVYPDGLRCVTVLIGVYHRPTGVPIFGVINQPFHDIDPQTSSWSGKCFWGVAYEGTTLYNSIPSASPVAASSSPVVVLSSSESPDLCTAMSPHFTLLDAAGAGYKLLCVITRHVDLYLLTKPSTFKWDTCSPQAILTAHSGGVLDLGKALEVINAAPESTPSADLTQQLVATCSVTYEKPDREDASEGSKWSNAGGLLAYRDINLAVNMLAVISKHNKK